MSGEIRLKLNYIQRPNWWFSSFHKIYWQVFFCSDRVTLFVCGHEHNNCQISDVWASLNTQTRRDRKISSKYMIYFEKGLRNVWNRVLKSSSYFSFKKEDVFGFVSFIVCLCSLCAVLMYLWCRHVKWIYTFHFLQMLWWYNRKKL